MYTRINNDVITGLMTLIGDPKKAKSAIEELNKAADAHDEAFAKMQKKQDEVNAAAAAFTKREKEVEATAKGFEKREAEIAAAKEEVAKQKLNDLSFAEMNKQVRIKLEEQTAEAVARIAAVTERENGIAAIEAKLKKREQQLSEKEQVVIAKEKELDEKLNKLKAAMG